MKKYTRSIIAINLILLLVLFNYSIVKKEQVITNGQLVLLELAPVDPRSLMQGDYMDLRYALANDIDGKEFYHPKGFCVVRLDKNNVATFIRIQKKTTPLEKGEYLVGFKNANTWTTSIGAESYFFQEGQAKKYEKAKYGGLRIDEEGNSVLVGLYDVNHKLIK